ncbi:MAG: DUF2730 family protein [Amylibacter sp.]|nr:DUF2730 family protein [Amylibacter sp.]
MILISAISLSLCSPVAAATQGADMSVEWIDTGLKLTSLLISLIAIAIAFFRTRKQHIEGAFKAGSKRMDAHDLRIQALEQSVNDLPGKDDMHQLELTLKEIGGDMKAIRATMRGMSESMTRTERIVGRHEEHLLERSKN